MPRFLSYHPLVLEIDYRAFHLVEIASAGGPVTMEPPRRGAEVEREPHYNSAPIYFTVMEDKGGTVA